MADDDRAESAGPDDTEPPAAAVSRRRMLGGAMLAGLTGTAVGAVGGGFAGYATAAAHHSGDDDTVDLRRSYPFYDQVHQNGIATPPKRYAVFMSFSLAAGAGRADLQALLARWSAAAAVLQQGKPVGTVQPQVDVQPPTDTGEAYGLGPASLTVTVGLGPPLFGDRFGLAARAARGFHRSATAQRGQPRPTPARW
jgi:deferrochelatase/peroxidase EfeB